MDLLILVVLVSLTAMLCGDEVESHQFLQNKVSLLLTVTAATYIFKN